VVKQRLHQERFRYLVLSAYRRQCAMCRLRHTPLLDAAHILPDRDERGVPEIPNGLALCRIHHGAYDVGILGVDPACMIHVRLDVLEEHDGPMLRHGLQELHGERIQTPRRADHLPNPAYLGERFARFEAA
jgi:putative restriction endonuclease